MELSGWGKGNQRDLCRVNLANQNSDGYLTGSDPDLTFLIGLEITSFSCCHTSYHTTPERLIDTVSWWRDGQSGGT